MDAWCFRLSIRQIFCTTLIVWLGLSTIVALPTSAAEVEARLGVKDSFLRSILNTAVTGLRVPTSKGGGISSDDSYVEILSVKDLTFNGDLNLSLAARLKTRFLFRISLTAKELNVVVDVRAEDVGGRPHLILMPRIARIDISGLPGIIERGIMRRANAHLNEVSVDISELVDFELTHPTNADVVLTPAVDTIWVKTDTKLEVILTQ